MSNCVLLDKGAPIPSEKTESFTLAEDLQTEAIVKVLQGKNDARLEDCLVLGEFVLKDLPPILGVHRIDVRLKIDRNGMLTATAIDTVGGGTAELQIEYQNSESPAGGVAAHGT